MVTAAKPLDRTWAEALVRDAEAQFNGRDLDAIARGYAADATLEMCSEGLAESFHGLAAISRAWRTVFEVFPKMQLRKQVASIDARGTVVNEWSGSVDGKSRAYGLDLWWIDLETRAVVRHKVVSFGRLVAPRSLAGSLRWLAIHPTSIFRLAKGLR